MAAAPPDDLLRLSFLAFDFFLHFFCFSCCELTLTYDRLPGVDGAVTAVGGVSDGILDRRHDLDVLVGEGDDAVNEERDG